MSSKLLALYGTEFEELDDEQKDPVSRRPTAVHDEVVTDERGRRRFHGAFTGGFSAGYFNTVGSKDGWKPQEFRSSRDERADQQRQRAEDFMDEDDLGEYGIASRRVRQTATFSGSQGQGAQKRRMAWEHEGAVGNLAERLENIGSDSIGIQMLRAMGWKQDRGVGLATNKERRGRGGDDDFDRSELSRVGKGVELSAEDGEVVEMQTVEGTHGLGYTGMSTTMDERFGHTESALKNKGKGRGMRGQAFGVGAFEDEDDNVYTNVDLSPYDFALGGGGRGPETQSIDATFVVSSNRLAPRRFYAPPRLPDHFRPVHQPTVTNPAEMPKGVQEKMETLTTVQRAKLLGEDRINLLELFPDKDRGRPKKGEKRSRWGVKKGEPEEGEPGAYRIVFPNEPMKQTRFKEFLYYLKRGRGYPQPTDMSVWEWESERKEFEERLTNEERGMLPEVRARTQPLAKTSLAMPLQELLQSKFVSEKGVSGKAATKDEDRMSAVKMDFFGDKTRTTHEWHPHKTLAKLFNVPNPFPHSPMVGCAHLQKDGKKDNFLTLGLPNTEAEMAFREESRRRGEGRDAGKEGGEGRREIKTEPGVVDETGVPSTSQDTVAEDTVDATVAGEWDRPPAELFAAIFADDTNEESESEGEEEDAEKDTEEIDATFAVSSSNRLAPRRFYAPPRLPDHFRPVHQPTVTNPAEMSKGVQEKMETLTTVQRAKNPPLRIVHLPDELLVLIYEGLLMSDRYAFSRMSRVLRSIVYRLPRLLKKHIGEMVISEKPFGFLFTYALCEGKEKKIVLPTGCVPESVLATFEVYRCSSVREFLQASALHLTFNSVVYHSRSSSLDVFLELMQLGGSLRCIVPWSIEEFELNTLEMLKIYRLHVSSLCVEISMEKKSESSVYRTVAERMRKNIVEWGKKSEEKVGKCVRFSFKGRSNARIHFKFWCYDESLGYSFSYF